MKTLCIIVTYNAMKWVDRCLQSIRQSSTSLDTFIVDNGSTDGTQDYIQENYKDVVFHQSSENLGFGRANNIGMNYALEHDYDYVYLLNQDAWILDDTIEKLIEVNKKYPKYGILSPFHMQANMERLDISFSHGVCTWNSNPDLLDDMYLQKRKEVYPVPDVMAAHWLISKECLKTVGCFSPTFPHYGEDYNYCDRALYHGFSIGIVPAAQAVHDREYRETTIEKILYLYGYISALTILSNFKGSQRWKWNQILRDQLKLTIRYKTFIPCKYLFRIAKEYKQLKLNKELSKGTGAFLQATGGK